MSLVDKVVKRVLLTSLFNDGWGDQETFIKLLQLRQSYKGGVSAYDSASLHFKLTELKKTSKYVRNYTGSFISPLCSESPDLLPEESQTCRFLLTLPSEWRSSRNRRVCLHYAATGDHSFWRRYRFLAHPLAKDYNIGSVIVENPFYGTRKPRNQVRSGIRYVSDLFTMGSALVVEADFLFNWLQNQGYNKLGISGVSLGGHNASLASAVWRGPLATVPCLSWSTAAHSFSEGIISSACMWDVLQDQLSPSKIQEIREVIQKTDTEIQEILEQRYGVVGDTSVPNSNTTAASKQGGRVMNSQYLSTLSSSLSSSTSILSTSSRTNPDKMTVLYMRLLMDEFSNLKHYPPLVCPEAAVVVVAKSDLYVTRPQDDDMIQDITEIWPGCEVRVVNGGHISSYLTHNHTFRKAINDAFDKLDVWLGHRKTNNTSC